MSNSALNSILLTVVIGLSGWTLVEVVKQGQDIATLKAQLVAQERLSDDLRLQIKELERRFR